MPFLQIQLLGDFLILADDKPVKGLHQSRLQSFLAYLLLHRRAPQSRQMLAFLFWPDSTERQAQTNLRKMLHHLRRVLPNADRFVQNDTKTVWWVPDASFTLDVAEFENKIVQVHVAAQEPQTAEKAKLLAEAVALYRGELLPGCYDDWILTEREQLHQQCLTALAQLMGCLEETRDYSAAIRYGQRVLALDPLHEVTYQRLMRLYVLNHDRAGALRIYHSCADVLARELGVEPATDTQELHSRLLRQDGLAPPLVRTPRRVSSTKLVGREAEWRQLQGAWRVATTVHSQFVLVAGEAGIGKTRLVEELQDWAMQQGVTTAHARAYAAAGSLAYAPVIGWLGCEPFQTVLARLDPVWRSEVARLLPDLLVQDPNLPRPEPLTERWQRQRLFEALTRVIRLAKSPLLLVLDDLQWCDVETLEWLHYLLRMLGEQQDGRQTQTHMMVVGTVRAEEIDAQHPLRSLLLELRRTGQVTEFELGPLDIADTATLAMQVAERELDSNSLHHFVEVSEGNPLFVVEMVRADNWEFEPVDGRDATNLPTLNADAISLPPKVQAVIQFRLEQLSPPARELARLATVIGRSFTFDILAQASDVDEVVLVQALDELWQRRIIRQQGDDAYDFSHDRIREAAYASVSPQQRRHLHRRVAQAIEQRHAGDLDSDSGQLGFHYERARRWEEGVKHYRRAADVSARLYAFEDTLFYLDKMLTLLKKLLPSTGHAHQQIEILLEIANILIITKGWTAEERRLALELAAKMARAVGDEKLLLNSLLSLYSYYGNVGDWYTCRNICDESLPLAEKFKDPISLLRANMQKADLSLHLGEFQSAILYHQRALLIEETSRPLHQFGSSWQIRMAEVLWFSGYPEQALKVASEGIRLIDKQEHPHARVHGIGFAIFVYHRIGDTFIVNQLVAETDELCERFGFANYALAAKLFAGWLKSQTGFLEEGLYQISQSLDELDQIGDQFYRPYYLTILAETQAKDGRIVDALNTLTRALDIVEKSGDRSWEAELHRLTGDVRFRLDPADMEVEQSYQLAFTISQRQGARSLELRAATSLARLWQSQKKYDEAHALLNTIYGWFTEGFDTPDLQAAKTLLNQLEMQISP